jgi:hypothetical protein
MAHREPMLGDGEVLLDRLEKVLAPAILEVGSDPFQAAPLGDALLASKTLEFDA